MALMGKLFSIIGDTSCKNFENIFNSKLHFNDLISKTPILSISNLKCIIKVWQGRYTWSVDIHIMNDDI